MSVVYGSSGGLTSSGGRLFTQVGGTVEAGDEFGEQLAAGDFNHDGFAELAAATPMEDVAAAANVGALSLLPGSGTGLTTTGGRLFTQASPGIPGTPETFDLFGGLEVVCAELSEIPGDASCLVKLRGIEPLTPCMPSMCG